MLKQILSEPPSFFERTKLVYRTEAQSGIGRNVIRVVSEALRPRIGLMHRREDLEYFWRTDPEKHPDHRTGEQQGDHPVWDDCA